MKWVLAEHDAAAAAALSSNAGLHPLIAKLLVNRGITEASAARAFLACDLSELSRPAIFSGMERAVARIRQALASGELITVYGDYDVDGVTGASVLYLALTRLGARVHCYIPDRMSEGYGLNQAALRTIRESGTTVVVTVDCGISAIQETSLARTLGLDLIITDHHEFDRVTGSNGSNNSDSSTLPDAFAVLHPALLLPDVPERTREQVSSLTGVGMAFKLAQALLELDGCDERMKEYLDLVTLGTVADVGRITGENRVFVKHGLERLSREDGSQRPGVTALKQVTGLTGRRISAGVVGFTLAPRINASGRLERADAAFHLLTTASPEQAAALASALDAVNRERQGVEESIHEQARTICRGQQLQRTGAFVLASSEWHPGVIGIVASRIVEEFYRPAALISVKEGVGKGSARSIPGFDLYQGLEECRDLLLGFGGHKYAAGFTIAEGRISDFRDRLNSLVLDRMGTEGFLRIQLVDGPVLLDDLTLELLKELDKLEPFGQGNPEPRLGARALEVLSCRLVGSNHLKLRLKQENGPALDAIAFNRWHLLGRKVREGSRIAAVFTPRLNAWNGKAAVELEIKDLKLEH